MSRPVRFHPGAVQDAQDAAGWYAERNARAAIRFLDELESLITRIAALPDMYPPFDDHLRRAVFQRFPFYVVFRVDESSVVVLAVAHGKRHPRFWQARNST